MVEEKIHVEFLISYSKHHKVRVQYENKCGRKPQNIKGLLNMQHDCAKWKSSQLLILYHASFLHKKGNRNYFSKYKTFNEYHAF